MSNGMRSCAQGVRGNNQFVTPLKKNNKWSLTPFILSCSLFVGLSSDIFAATAPYIHIYSPVYGTYVESPSIFQACVDEAKRKGLSYLSHTTSANANGFNADFGYFARIELTSCRATNQTTYVYVQSGYVCPTQASMTGYPSSVQCLVCPVGTVDVAGACLKDPSKPIPEKNFGLGNCVGNPVNGGTGNKYQREIDSTHFGDAFLLARHYNSRLVEQSGGLGYNWNLTAAIRPVSATKVSVVRPDRQTIGFTLVESTWTPLTDVTYALENTTSGWQVTTPEREVENYDVAGHLLSVNRPGFRGGHLV